MTQSSVATRPWAVVALAALLVGALPAARAHASGFALNEASARLMGTAYAGSAALAEDATTGYYNVAGLTRIKQGSLAGTITGYLLALDFEATSATDYGMPVSGGRDVDPTRDAVIPTFHAGYRLHEDWVVGLGVTVPYGLEIKYPASSAVRYVATKSQLLTYNVNPMIAYRITDQWSVGAGFNAQYLEAKLEQKVRIPPPFPNPHDGDLFVRLNNWAYGANFGILFEPCEVARVGINYRSQINYSLSGPTKVSGIPGIKSGDVESDVTVPDTVTASAVVNALPGLQLLGNLTWTHWDVFDKLEATFNNGLPDLIILEDFRDTWNAAIGANYDFTKEWALRMGFAYDQSPVTDNNRTVRLPDANRWFLSAGVGFHLTDDIVFDLGYMHIFFEDGTVDEADEQPGNAVIRGNYSGGRGDLISFQGTYNFDHLFQFYDSLKQRIGS